MTIGWCELCQSFAQDVKLVYHKEFADVMYEGPHYACPGCLLFQWHHDPDAPQVQWKAEYETSRRQPGRLP